MGLCLSWVAMFMAVWLVMLGQTSTALTTFGKTNPNTQNQPPPPPPPVKARDCRSGADCAGIEGTSCVRDRGDDKTKCLCGDNSAPVNGACSSKLKGLRHACNDNSECMEEMICAIKNNSVPSSNTFGSSRGDNSGGGKMCMCNEAEGYIEQDHECSGSPPMGMRLITFSSIIFVSRLILQLY